MNIPLISLLRFSAEYTKTCQGVKCMQWDAPLDRFFGWCFLYCDNLWEVKIAIIISQGILVEEHDITNH